MTHCTPAQARAIAERLDHGSTSTHQAIDALRSLADQLEQANQQHIAEFGELQDASTAQSNWLRDGGLLYRLTDGPRPENRDEINVTMVDGSRDDDSRAARAQELLEQISGNPGQPGFQARVQPWMLACFGDVIAADREERNHRFLEEALELVQSLGCTAHEAHQLVDYVYGRPVGEPAQEVGGVMVTLAALCLANGLDMHDAAEVELARIWTKVEAIRAKQAAKPKHSPLPAAAPTTPKD